RYIYRNDVVRHFLLGQLGRAARPRRVLRKEDGLVDRQAAVQDEVLPEKHDGGLARHVQGRADRQVPLACALDDERRRKVRVVAFVNAPQQWADATHARAHGQDEVVARDAERPLRRRDGGDVDPLAAVILVRFPHFQIEAHVRLKNLEVARFKAQPLEVVVAAKEHKACDQRRAKHKVMVWRVGAAARFDNSRDVPRL
ncbi:hypothetical protein M885DRAFT_544847, partial [Pelagophyceae sp. CCMP2097]